MAPVLNVKGDTVKMSFLDLFAPSRPSRRSTGTPRVESKKPKTKSSPPPAETSPQSNAATEASTEPTVVIETGSAEWTRLEELALLGMKAEDMTWKEIEEMLPGKDVENIEKKYRELYVPAPSSVKPMEGDGENENAKKEEETKDGKEEVKTVEAKPVEERVEKKSEDRKSRKEVKRGKKSHKEYKAQKGKGKAACEKSEEAKSEGRPAEIKGILKAKATATEKGKDGELKSINGHPIIFVDDDGELDFDELRYLYALNVRYDEMKWMNIESKFFDRFGKRVGAEKLKEKLAGT